MRHLGLHLSVTLAILFLSSVSSAVLEGGTGSKPTGVPSSTSKPSTSSSPSRSTGSNQQTTPSTSRANPSSSSNQQTTPSTSRANPSSSSNKQDTSSSRTGNTSSSSTGSLVESGSSSSSSDSRYNNNQDSRSNSSSGNSSSSRSDGNVDSRSNAHSDSKYRNPSSSNTNDGQQDSSGVGCGNMMGCGSRSNSNGGTVKVAEMTNLQFIRKIQIQGGECVSPNNGLIICKGGRDGGVWQIDTGPGTADSTDRMKIGSIGSTPVCDSKACTNIVNGKPQAASKLPASYFDKQKVAATKKIDDDTETLAIAQIIQKPSIRSADGTIEEWRIGYDPLDLKDIIKAIDLDGERHWIYDGSKAICSTRNGSCDY